MGPISNIHVWQLSVRVSLWTLYRERHRSPHTYWVLIEPWPNRYVAFFVQRSQSCHTHSISPSYLLLSNQRKKQKSHCAALLLLFGILHFPSNIIHQIFFSPTFFVLLFISHFLFSHPCCSPSVFIAHSSSVFPDFVMYESRGICTSDSYFALHCPILVGHCQEKYTEKTKQWYYHCTHLFKHAKYKKWHWIKAKDWPVLNIEYTACICCFESDLVNFCSVSAVTPPSGCRANFSMDKWHKYY